MKILILGAGVYQVPLIRRAKARGLYTIVASTQGNYPGFSLADQVYYVNTTDKEAILKIAREEKIDAITTTGTDVAVVSIGYVCSEMRLPGINADAAVILTDKALMKEAFQHGDVTTAPFRRVTSIEEARKAVEAIGLPAVLKIVDKSGSRGITKITDLSQLQDAYAYATAATNADHMLVEQFIDGREIGIDAFVQNGELKLMLPHDKYVYHTGHTGIPIGHYCPMAFSERLYAVMRSETEKIIHGIGIDNCAVNIDAFVCAGERVFIIEAAGRCGATGIPEVISGYTGRNYYDSILDNALGIQTDSFSVSEGTPTASLLLLSEKAGRLKEIRYCFAGKEYCNTDAELEGFGRVELSFQPGDEIHAFQNGTDRIGQAVFYGKTAEALQQTVERFRAGVHIEVEE